MVEVRGENEDETYQGWAVRADATGREQEEEGGSLNEERGLDILFHSRRLERYETIHNF